MHPRRSKAATFYCNDFTHKKNFEQLFIDIPQCLEQRSYLCSKATPIEGGKTRINESRIISSLSPQKEENEKFQALIGQTYITRFGFNFVLFFNAKNRTYNTSMRPCL